MKRLKLILVHTILFVLGFDNLVFSQADLKWAITKTGEQSNMAIDSAGNVYSYWKPNLSWYTLIVRKYDMNGNFIWEKSLESELSHITGFTVNKIAADSNGDLYIAATQYGYYNDVKREYDQWILIKYDTDGNLKWTRVFYHPASERISDENNPADLLIDKEGNIIISGFISINGSSSYHGADVATLKYSPDGNLLWHRIINNMEDTGYCDGETTKVTYIRLGQDTLSNVFVAVWFRSAYAECSEDRVYTVKYDTHGNDLFDNIFPSDPSDRYMISSIDSYIDVYGNFYLIGGLSDLELDVFEGIRYYDMGVIKYNPNGTIGWQKKLGSVYNDDVKGIVADNNGNVYLLGNSNQSANTSDNAWDIVITAFDSIGTQLWMNNYSDTNYCIHGTSMAITHEGVPYILGTIYDSDGWDLLILAYDSEGSLIWKNKYPGVYPRCYVNNPYYPYFFGFSIIMHDTTDFYIHFPVDEDLSSVLKYSFSGILKPKAYDKWIAGENDTIRWTGIDWPRINIICQLNYGSIKQENHSIAQNIQPGTEFVWQIPDTLLSYRTRIIIESAEDNSQRIFSDVFRIKPYLLTRVGEDSLYYEYEKRLDQWGFSNTETQMWPPSWWIQFNYKDIDPFTKTNYPNDGFGIFSGANPFDFPDWVSWVNTFSIDQCYRSVLLGLYSPTALFRWDAVKGVWNGSCFGIAVANAMAFNDRLPFIDYYPLFPDFIDPVNVISTDNVKKVINELSTHQFGNPHLTFWKNSRLNTTPSQTVSVLKDILKEDDVSFLNTMSIANNSESGAHTVLPYMLRIDENHPEINHIYTYDSSNPDSEVPFIVNTSAMGANGSWTSNDWPGWGGNKWIIIDDPALSYLVNPSISKKSLSVNAFSMSDTVLQVFTSEYKEFLISNESGKITGFANQINTIEIPGSIPVIVKNGSQSPPIGFDLPFSDYSISYIDTSNNIPRIYFFTGNKTFRYTLNNPVPGQRDKLRFNDGMIVSHYKTGTKNMDLLYSVFEIDIEKVFLIKELKLTQNDSLTFKPVDDDKLQLINHGKQTSYGLLINYVSNFESKKLEKSDITLEEKTTHILQLAWDGLPSSKFRIYVDNGSDGVIDDTLLISQQPTSAVDIFSEIEYSLEQNYPNPFSRFTRINWHSSTEGRQTLQVYSINGTLVSTLVDEHRQAGSYSIVFDGNDLPSGIYYIKLKTSNIASARKMILLKE